MLEGVVGDDLDRIDAARRLLDPLLREILAEAGEGEREEPRARTRPDPPIGGVRGAATGV